MAGRLLITGGWLVTMARGEEPFLGELLIEGETIVAAGPSLGVEDAETIDARGRIVLPGFVDAHRHTWQSSLRMIAADWTLGQYFQRMRGQLALHFRPEDTYAGTLLGAVEALDGGVTTLVDWSHNLNTPAHADAAWQALKDANGRAVLAYGATNAQALSRDGSPHTRDVARLLPAAGGLLGLALALRGPEFSSLEAVEADWSLARELGLAITVHVGGGLGGTGGSIHKLHERGLLGSDTTYVHCNMLADEELRLIADSGGQASVSPELESNMGHGPPATGRLLAHGIAPSLSVDSCSNVGGDMFSAMRVALAVQRGADHAAALERGEQLEAVSLRARDALELATVNGARACHLGDLIGTLEPGKQADVLLLSTEAPNLAPVDDPVAAVVLAANPANVDTVLVAGRVVKSAGRLVETRVGDVLELARESRDHLLRARAREA